jgi:hypothetical protein
MTERQPRDEQGLKNAHLPCHLRKFRINGIFLLVLSKIITTFASEIEKV